MHNSAFMTVAGAGGSPVTLVSHPVRYDGCAPEVRLPPQPLGAQTTAILTELGFADAEIGTLRDGGVIADAPPIQDPPATAS
jgi:crotonobetainyl-CoA:carnitine CoA-transferase CaiB-like acyl-CoA transferase